MKYTYHYSEYIKQLQKYKELEKMDFSSCLSKEELIKKLEERSYKKREIADISNTIVNEYIGTFEKDPALLTNDDVLTLEDFYNKIIDPSSDLTLDHGLLLRISRILKDYYKDKDLHQYLNKLKTCVIYERILLYNHSNVYYESVFTNECMEMAQRIADLSDDDKAVLVMTFYWIGMCHEDDEGRKDEGHPIDRILEIDQYLCDLLHTDNPITYPKVNPLSIVGNLLNIFCEFSFWTARHHLKMDVPKYRSFAERCLFILRFAIENNQLGGIPNVLSAKGTIYHVEYILGDITFEELLDKITALQQYDESEPTVLKVLKLAKFNFQYLTYLTRYSGYPKETIVELSQTRIKEVLPIIKKLTEKENNATLNLFLLFFIVGVSYTSQFDEFSQTILDLTVYSDKALYVHTEMVQELSLVLFDYLVESNPEFFTNVANNDVNYIKSHKQEMRNLLRDCCRFHDIGKFFMIDVVENSFRNLTDEEFEIINYHPVAFKDFVESNAAHDPNIKCIHDCMVAHHLWHDGSKGYPKVKHTNNRPFVDVLSIADSIDAATDSYGRPYRQAKTLDDLIQEFQNEAGTRYSEVVVAALNNPIVKAKIELLINEGRKDIYYKVYTNKKTLT